MLEDKDAEQARGEHPYVADPSHLTLSSTVLESCLTLCFNGSFHVNPSLWV